MKTAVLFVTAVCCFSDDAGEDLHLAWRDYLILVRIAITLTPPTLRVYLFRHRIISVSYDHVFMFAFVANNPHSLSGFQTHPNFFSPIAMSERRNNRIDLPHRNHISAFRTANWVSFVAHAFPSADSSFSFPSSSDPSGAVSNQSDGFAVPSLMPLKIPM